jgi:hypothetical protein
MTAGNEVPVTGDIPVKVYGILDVGDKVNESGGLNLYRLKGHKVDVTSKPKWWFFG